MTTLMQNGDFELVMYEKIPNDPYPDLHSYITHTCGKSKYSRYLVWESVIEMPCAGCGKIPPEDILGLWRLHNFDWIQSNPFGAL